MTECTDNCILALKGLDKTLGGVIGFGDRNLRWEGTFRFQTRENGDFEFG